MDFEQVLGEKYKLGVLSKEMVDNLESPEQEHDASLKFPSMLGRPERKWRSVWGGFPEGGDPKQIADVAPITNRGGSFSQVENIDFECPHIMGGYDGGVEIGFNGVWNERKFSDLLEILQLAKKKSVSSVGYFVINDQYFRMFPFSGVMGVTYNYVFVGNGVTFYVHQTPSKQIQPIRIRFNAEGLIGVDFFEKYIDVVNFISRIGFSIECEKLSRVDMQVMVNRRVSDFINSILQQRYVCNAKRASFHGSGVFNLQTFTLGTDLQLCIYDKREELFSGGQPEKLYLMVKYCFGKDWLLSDIPCTRIEFRLRRDILKDFDINTCDDLFDKENSLVEYLTTRWFRLLQEDRKKTHTSRQASSEIWREVSNEFLKWFPGREGHRKQVKRNYRRVSSANDMLLLQAAGCLASFIGKNVDISDIDSCDVRVNDIMDKLRVRIQDRAYEHSKNLQISSRVVKTNEIVDSVSEVSDWSAG
ncbi:MAG: hypothetical protein LBE18_01340 [Planctomycetaceae bacterium]|jgi:hypothetical protein|nr:hypothetical protein [Planctomycetaceae bacterium]